MPWWAILLMLFGFGIWTVLCIILGMSFGERARTQTIVEERSKWLMPQIHDKE